MGADASSHSARPHQLTRTGKELALRVLPAAVRFGLWNRIAYAPGLADLYFFLDPSLRGRRVTRETELVIEGFPRAGNTYSRAAFEYANGRGHQITSNFHTPRTIELAAKHHVPTIVLIRTPVQAAGSTLQFHPDATPNLMLLSYQRFYRRVLPCISNVVVADFSEVTTAFGNVIDRVNNKFGTTFARYERTDEAERAVDQAIEAAADVYTDDERPFRISKPSADRKSPTEIVAQFNEQEKELLAEAVTVYEQILRASGAPSAHLGDLAS